MTISYNISEFIMHQRTAKFIVAPADQNAAVKDTIVAYSLGANQGLRIYTSINKNVSVPEYNELTLIIRNAG